MMTTNTFIVLILSLIALVWFILWAANLHWLWREYRPKTEKRTKRRPGKPSSGK